MDYTNSHLEVPALIQTLKDRGLSITDDNKSLAFLENVSYFRFRIYLRPYIHVLSVLKSVCKVTKQYLYNQIITEKIRKKNAVRKYLNGRQLPLLSPGQTAREYRD